MIFAFITIVVISVDYTDQLVSFNMTDNISVIDAPPLPIIIRDGVNVFFINVDVIIAIRPVSINITDNQTVDGTIMISDTVHPQLLGDDDVIQSNVDDGQVDAPPLPTSTTRPAMVFGMLVLWGTLFFIIVVVTVVCCECYRKRCEEDESSSINNTTAPQPDIRTFIPTDSYGGVLLGENENDTLMTSTHSIYVPGDSSTPPNSDEMLDA